MLQIADLDKYTENDIPQLLDTIRPILKKRKDLFERYSRGGSDSKVMYAGTDKQTVLPFEKYITDLATGYVAGKPTYTVEVSKDEDKNKILLDLLDKVAPDDDYVKSMNVVIDHIKNYNDDGQENYDLIHDLLMTGACYELIYENKDNEVIYTSFSPLQTVATWDYQTPANLTGLIRTWDEKDLNSNTVTIVELTDKFGTRKYEVNGKKVSNKEVLNHNWGDVPGFAVETDMAIFEPCEDLIRAYEQLVQNTRNTYQYNDTDCKLMFMNYTAENPLTVIDSEGKTIMNPARQLEDNLVLQSKTFYVGQDGDVKWLSKPVDANGITTIQKMYLDGIFQLGSTPNTADLAFNSNDLNAAAIDRKFYVMNMMTSKPVSLLEKAYLRRWELTFNRINLKKGTNFDFRDIEVDIPKNLPANNDEMADFLLKLDGKISDETIVSKLGFNYLSEKAKIEDETEDNLLNNLTNTGNINEQQGISGQSMENNGTDFEEIS